MCCERGDETVKGGDLEDASAGGRLEDSSTVDCAWRKRINTSAPPRLWVLVPELTR